MKIQGNSRKFKKIQGNSRKFKKIQGNNSRTFKIKNWKQRTKGRKKNKGQRARVNSMFANYVINV